MPAGLTVLQTVCNNGREVISAIVVGQVSQDLYSGPRTDLFPGQGTGNLLYLNSENDILWNDPSANSGSKPSISPRRGQNQPASSY